MCKQAPVIVVKTKIRYFMLGTPDYTSTFHVGILGIHIFIKRLLEVLVYL